MRLAQGLVRPEREVLLSAGAIDSPRLLMRPRSRGSVKLTSAFAGWRAREIYPGPPEKRIADRHDFVRRAANSSHYPTGTCRMGAVVDDALRVTGLAGLRVIDASVIPAIPQAMINAATIALAEKAADLVLAG